MTDTLFFPCSFWIFSCKL